MNNTVFPLRSLPEHIQLHIIKSFNYDQLASFSFISNKSKELVESLNVKITEVWVTDEYPHCHERLRWVLHRADKKFGEVPESIHIDYEYTWKNTGISFQTLFERIRCLFTTHQYVLAVDREEEFFDTVALKNLVPRWSKVILRNVSHDYGQQLINVFLSNAGAFTIGKPFNEPELPTFPQKIGIQNFDVLTLFDRYQLTLDDALIMNSRNFQEFKLSIKEANRFIKLWMKGSNRRIKKMKICLNEDLNEERMLKGIKYHVFPGKESVRFRRYVRHDQMEDDHENAAIHFVDVLCYAKIRIRNKKGVLATLEIDNKNGYSCNVTIEVGEC